MVSKHEQSSKESVDYEYSTDSPSSASTPDLDESSSEPKAVVWQRNISGSVKARINVLESQAQARGFARSTFSPTLTKSSLPKVLSLDRAPVNNGETDGDGKAVEICSAVKSRPYRPHHSAQLLRSKTMPSVLLQKAEGVPDETVNDSSETSKWSVTAKRSIFMQPVRTSFGAPRASSIDDGSNNARYNAYESMGFTKPLLTSAITSAALRKSFNGGIGSHNFPSTQLQPSIEKSIDWSSKENLLKPESSIRSTRSLTPEGFPPRPPPIVRQNKVDSSATTEITPAESHIISATPISQIGLTLNWDSKLKELQKKFPFINEKTVFKMSLEKNSRGLGIGICGGRDPTTADNWSSIFIRIKRLYPLQPALESGRLKIGDIILRVNDHQLTDLSHHEAVEALRVASGSIFLVICRPPAGVLPTLPMEFEVELEKCGGSLGFTLVNDSNSHEVGHFIKDLVKDPALSDGRIKPGDQILMVNDTDLKGLSHEETIQCLRKSPPVVRLVLSRPQSTPPSSPPTNPTVEDLSKQDRKVLRKEAQDLLTDKIRRKSFESNSNSTCSSSGRRQRLKGYNTSNSLSVDSAGEQSTPSNSDVDSRRSTPTPTDYFRVPNVRSFLSQEALDAADSPPPSLVPPSSPHKPTFLNLEHKNLDSYKGLSDKFSLSPGSVPSLHVSAWEPETPMAKEEAQLRSSEVQIAYVNGDSNNTDQFSLSPSSSFRRVVSCDVMGGGGLTHSTPKENFSAAGLKKWRGAALENGHNQEKVEETTDELMTSQTAWEMMVIELNKQKNDRLGFTLLAVEVGNLKGSFVRNVHPGGLASEDRRLQPGDHLLKINGVSTANMPNNDVIEILRKQQGKIVLEIARHCVVSSLIINLIKLSLV